MSNKKAKVDDLSRLKLRRRFLRRVFAIIVLFLLVSSTLYLLLSNQFRIKEINIIGAESLSKGLIEEKVKNKLLGHYYYFFPKENIILYPSIEIKSEVEKISKKIESVEVYRSGLDKITINLIERRPAYLWCYDQEGKTDCYFVDKNGIIYTNAPTFSAPVYIEFHGGLTTDKDVLGKTFVTKEKLDRIIDLVALLKKEEILVKKLFLEEFDDIRVISNKDYELRISLKAAVEESVKNLRLSLASDNLKPEVVAQKGGLKYIDLRFDKKVYYKFNN